MSGTDVAYAVICLRACYAMSGTDLAYAAIVCYAMSGTGLAAICLTLSGTELLAYGATREIWRSYCIWYAPSPPYA
eukprot:3802399-Rhodomonas_salina.1